MDSSRQHHAGCFGTRNLRRVAGDAVLEEIEATVAEADVPDHTHEAAHFVLVLHGDYVSSAVGMPELSRGPVLVLNPPGTEHRDRFRGGGGRFLTLSFSRAAWLSAGPVATLPDHALRMDDLAVAQAAMLGRELRRWDECSSLAVEAGLSTLLLAAGAQARQESPDGPAWLARVRERLADDLSVATPSIGDLAQLADVHPVYLARAFRRRYGCGPAAYLRRQRVSRAIRCLRETDRPLAEVASECGYADQAHLTHAVRRDVGTTPAVLRRLLRVAGRD